MYKYGQNFSLTSKINKVTKHETIRINKIKNVFFFSFSTTTKQLFATSSLTRESRTLMRERKKKNNFFLLFVYSLLCCDVAYSQIHGIKKFPDVLEFKLYDM